MARFKYGKTWGHKSRHANSITWTFDASQPQYSLARMNYAFRMFHVLAGRSIALGGGEILRHYVRKEMRPPQSGYEEKLVKMKAGDSKKNMKKVKVPKSPTKSYAWYTGTYRRSLTVSPRHSGRYISRAVMGPKKETPPFWAYGADRVPTTTYAKYLEFGTKKPEYPHRPVFAKGFKKGWRPTFKWMETQMYTYFKVVVYSSVAGRLAGKWRVTKMPGNIERTTRQRT